MRSVSVIIPAWGDTPWLAEAVASVKRQQHIELELIVVAPPDGKPQTAIAARMEGVKRASGEYVTFVDADDEFIGDDAVAQMVEAAEADGADVLCAGFVRSTGERLPPLDIWQCAPSDIFNAMYAKLFRRELFDGIELNLSIRLGEDLAAVAQALYRAHRVKTLPKAVYRYRDNTESITHRQDGRSRVNDIKKVGELLARRLPKREYDWFFDRVTRDALLLMLRHRVFDRQLWRELRGRLSSPLLGDTRHGFVKKGALAIADCVLNR